MTHPNGTNGTTAAPSTVTVDGFLFDMDGTLLDSTPAVLATWNQFAIDYNLDLAYVLRSESACVCEWIFPSIA